MSCPEGVHASEEHTACASCFEKLQRRLAGVEWERDALRGENEVLKEVDEPNGHGVWCQQIANGLRRERDALRERVAKLEAELVAANERNAEDQDEHSAQRAKLVTERDETRRELAALRQAVEEMPWRAEREVIKRRAAELAKKECDRG